MGEGKGSREGGGRKERDKGRERNRDSRKVEIKMQAYVNIPTQCQMVSLASLRVITTKM